MAFIAAPLVAEFVLVAGETLAGFGASEAVATGVSAYIGKELLKKVDDVAYQLVEKVVGKENIEGAQQTLGEFGQIIEDGAAAGVNAYITGNPSHYVKPGDQRAASSINRTNNSTNPQFEWSPPNQSDYQKYLSSYGMGDNPGATTGGSDTVTTGINTYSANQDSNSDIINVDFGGEAASDAIDYTPKQLSDLIVRQATALAFGETPTPDGVVDTAINAVSDNIEDLSLFQRMNKYYADMAVPTNDQYLEIAAVYNGRALTYPEGISMTFDEERQLIRFDWVNEIGAPQTLFQTTGIIIPSVYGVFGGANSRNSEFPIDYLDSLYMNHDLSYVNGPSLVGDYQLIARIVNNMDRIPPEGRSFARTSVIYFATIGSTISALYGSLPGDTVADVPVPQVTKDDVFPVVVPSSLQLPDDEYVVARFEFYRDFEKAMEASQVQHGIMAPTGKAASMRLLQLFNNMQIELL